jgi:hypothetical protein
MQTKDESSLGRNRTGTHLAPARADDMAAAARSTPGQPSGAGDESRLAGIRAAYIEEAEPLGSMPPPASVKGIVKSSLTLISGRRPQVLLDRIGERMQHERSGVRIYEALITKHAAEGAADVPGERLREFKADEARHFALLTRCVERLGGDPTAQTPCADLAGIETIGLLQAVTDPKTSFLQSLHAVVIGELADNAGWDELVMLAEKLGHADIADEFRSAREAERRHLAAVREWHERLTLAQAEL